MRQVLKFAILLIATGCGATSKKPNSIEMIASGTEQDAVFHDLVAITNTIIPEHSQSDSLAFLVLPLQASCPACRNKTIDSIVKHQDDLLNNHFIILSINGTRKKINGFFQENNKKMPDMEGRLILDSNNNAFKHRLYTDKPVMYYTYNKKAFKKVAAVPATVKDDLSEFFSGYRK